jgi:predicted nucleic acid-binding Zn ribbon protein
MWDLSTTPHARAARAGPAAAAASSMASRSSCSRSEISSPLRRHRPPIPLPSSIDLANGRGVHGHVHMRRRDHHPGGASLCLKQCQISVPRMYEPRHCQKCGVAFMARGSKGYLQRFCSGSCQRSARTARRRERREQSHPQMTCPICGATFALLRSTARYCSTTCRLRARRQRRRADLQAKAENLVPEVPSN